MMMRVCVRVCVCVHVYTVHVNKCCCCCCCCFMLKATLHIRLVQCKCCMYFLSVLPSLNTDLILSCFRGSNICVLTRRLLAAVIVSKTTRTIVMLYVNRDQSHWPMKELYTQTRPRDIDDWPMTYTLFFTLNTLRLLK